MLKFRIQSPTIKSAVLEAHDAGRLDEVELIANAHIETANSDMGTAGIEYDPDGTEYDQDTIMGKDIALAAVSNLDLELYNVMGIQLSPEGSDLLVEIRED